MHNRKNNPCLIFVQEDEGRKLDARAQVRFLPLALRGHRLHLPMSYRERANQFPGVLRVQTVGVQTPRVCGGGPVHTQGIMRHNLWA